METDSIFCGTEELLGKYKEKNSTASINAAQIAEHDVTIDKKGKDVKHDKKGKPVEPIYCNM
eukprot:1448131-Ditylum_brightwellii.AAC.1